MSPEERLDRLERMMDKNQILSAQILESVMRLERIALSHTLSIEEINIRLDQLENKKRKTQ